MVCSSTHCVNRVTGLFYANCKIEQMCKLCIFFLNSKQDCKKFFNKQMTETNFKANDKFSKNFYIFPLWVYIIFTFTPLYNMYKIFSTSCSTWLYDRNRVFVRILFSLMLHFDILKMSLSEKGKQGYIKVLKFSHVIFVFHIRM